MMRTILASSPQSSLSRAAIMTTAHMASAAAAPAAQKLLTASALQFLRLGRLDVAESLIERALTEDECWANEQSLLANIIDRRGDWQGLARLRQAHVLAPDSPQGRLNLALALLRLDDYREGFALYEARLDKSIWPGFATLASRGRLRHRPLGPGHLSKTGIFSCSPSYEGRWICLRNTAYDPNGSRH
jgi:tetratricopeptide (TPR) repeat protein